MKNIKVYNVKKLIEEKEIQGKKYKVHIDTELAIIEGTKGAIIFDDEACGKICESTNDTYVIGLDDLPEKKEDGIIMFNAIAPYSISPTLKELQEADNRECLLTDFVTGVHYKSRIKNNYWDLLKAFDKIGINSEEYNSLEG